jgi:hypothetical protein
MPRVIIDKLRGVNSTKASLQLAPGDFQWLQNVRQRPVVNFAKRPGVETVTSVDNPVMGIASFEFDNGLVVPIWLSEKTLTFFPDVANLANGTNPLNPTPTANGSALDTNGSYVRNAQPGGGGCTWSVAPTGFSVAVEGASDTATLTTGMGCSWDVASSDSWIAFTRPPTTGLSAATIYLTVQSNEGNITQRTGTITFHNRVASTSNPVVGSDCATITVTQAADTVPATTAGLTGDSYQVTASLQKVVTPTECKNVNWDPGGTDWDGVLPYVSAANNWSVNFPTRRWWNNVSTGNVALTLVANEYWSWTWTGVASDPPYDAQNCGYRKYFGKTPGGTYTLYNPFPVTCGAPTSISLSAVVV